MTQENKDLLFKDLSPRLAYRVKFPIYWWNEETQTDEEIVATLYSINTDGYCEIFDHDGTVYIDNIKPYLRPMSSMTKEEEKVFGSFIFTEHHGWDGKTDYHEYVCIDNINKFYDWLNKNMFDYRGLIPRGLALEAKEGMYDLELLHYSLPLQNESDSEIDSSTKITVGCKIRSKTSPYEILSIISDDCHGDEFECSNGSVLSLEQIKKHYDLYVEENKGTIVIN